jgi:hypothetical protein
MSIQQHQNTQKGHWSCSITEKYPEKKYAEAASPPLEEFHFCKRFFFRDLKKKKKKKRGQDKGKPGTIV